MADDKELFYVGVREASEVRRAVLEASKRTIKSLQMHERFKDTRQEKALQTAKLRSILLELDELITRLDEELPKTKLKERVRTAKGPAPLRPLETMRRDAGGTTELERLELSLNAIEDKLKKISG
ncbi:hypothetical protein JXB02_03270 [Candidatus Woesearchaeota archaeon]|nr:hypothetical protein [Candidatus Woesearchaeota archaeon]